MQILKKFIALLTALFILPMSADTAGAEYYTGEAGDDHLDIYYDYDSDYSILIKPVSDNAVQISWEPVKNAESYVLAMVKTGREPDLKDIKNGRTYCRVASLKKGEIYHFELYAKNGGRLRKIAGNIKLSVSFDAPVRFHVPEKSSVKMTLAWEKTDGASGYELEHYGSEGWTRLKSFDTAEKTRCELSGLKPAVLYKFRLRAFKNSGSDKVYSDYAYTEAYTDAEKLPSGITLSGANMVYVGESFDFKYTFTDGKDHTGHKIVWSVSSPAAKVSENGRLTALSSGKVNLTVTDDTAGIADSMLVHCVGSPSEVDFVPMIFGVPITNKTYPLPADYDPGMDKETLSAYTKMALDAQAEGLNFFIISSYRSYTRQKELYTYWSNLYGKSSADRVSARPGHSEHQLGLAIDVNSCYYDFIGTPEQVWLAANCYKYGFILRYPSFEAEAVTGYAYEPWHIRYLGRELAEKVHKSGLTLEEYLGIDSKYRD